MCKSCRKIIDDYLVFDFLVDAFLRFIFWFVFLNTYCELDSERRVMLS